MALTSTSAVAQRLALELGGKAAGVLRSLQLAGFTAAEHAGGGTSANRALRPTAFDAEFAVAGPSNLLDWALSLARRRVMPTSGAAVIAGVSGQVSRRVEWSDALLTELRLPTLDAADAKVPFVVGISWQPMSISEGAAGDRIAMPLVSKIRQMMSSNFSVSGLPFDAAGISRIRLPTVRGPNNWQLDQNGVGRWQADYAPEIGPVDLEVSPSIHAEAMRAWVFKSVQSGAMPTLDLEIQMLDVALKKTLASIRLGGCRLTDFAEHRLQLNAERLAPCALRFSVATLEMKL